MVKSKVEPIVSTVLGLDTVHTWAQVACQSSQRNWKQKIYIVFFQSCFVNGLYLPQMHRAKAVVVPERPQGNIFQTLSSKAVLKVKNMASLLKIFITVLFSFIPGSEFRGNKTR